MNLQKILSKCAVLVVLLSPLSASALVMRANGPEPVIVQIKESLRTSDDLDNRLDELVSVRNQNRLSVVKWWAGRKLLVMLSFPTNFTEQQAAAVIVRLQQLAAVEKVVPVSAFNLYFRSGDFVRSYGASEPIPDVSRRGFDAERIGKPVFSPPDQIALAQRAHASNRLIVRWRDEYVWKAEQTGFLQRIANLHRDAGCRVVREQRQSPTRLSHVLEFDDPSTLADKLKRYMDSGLVEYAQPDYIYKAAATPNDPVYGSQQWTLPLISAPEAWDLTTGDHSVIIAVGDSGANVNHPDFSPNLWSGQNDPNTGVHNFYDGGQDVTDNFGHGSLVASIIGARGNNGLYMTGVAWDVSLMILKVIGPTGHFSHDPMDPESERDAFSSSVSGAISYASANHATAINLSLASSYFEYTPTGTVFMYDPAIQDAIGGARDNGEGGMLVVAAAGNGSSDNDNDTYPLSPTSIPFDNVISVGATDINDQRALYSNIGRYRVDLGAPGGTDTKKIIGLSQTVGYYSFDRGTSFAAPHVTGAAALVKSKYPWENYFGIRDRILMGVDHVPVSQTDSTPRFENTFRTKGRLNLYNALQPRSMVRNLSTRARVEDGDRVMIAGFVIGGSTPVAGAPTPPPLKVLIRGIGPSLPVGGDRLGNPKITLRQGNTTIDSNDDWQNHATAGEIQSRGFAPGNALESALIATLQPGAYTVVLEDAGNQHGVGLFEIYELDDNEQSRLLNLSTRCLVGTGDDVAIAGSYVGDPNQAGPKPDRRLLILGKGPSLTAFNLSGVLSDPQLEARDSGGALLASNDQWQTIDDDSGSGHALEEKLSPSYSGFAPANLAESVLWPTFRPGGYTVILSGANGSTGIGLIEFYEY
ncbi:MAG: thermitase [Verrucomicrobiota bacterium]|jgi:subtilisin family serine protease